MLVTINIGHSTLPSAKLFGNNCQIVKLANIILVVEKNHQIVYHWYMALQARGGLNKDPIVWLGGARPANTCIPPTFPSGAPHRDNS